MIFLSFLQDKITKVSIAVMDHDERKVIEALATWDIDHKKAFIKGVLRSVLDSFL